MTPIHDWRTNLRLWSVQAGIAGGSLTAALGAFQTAMTAMNEPVTVPSWAFIACGILTAVGVFGGRMFAQPDVLPPQAPTGN